MAIVNIQENPMSSLAGTRDMDAVIIQSERVTSRIVTYQIENIATTNVINIDSRMNDQSVEGNLVSVNSAVLKIILEFRTRYRVRTRQQTAVMAQPGEWDAWVNFTTRDKRYQSPDAITTLTDDTDSTAQTQGTKLNAQGQSIAQGGNRTIVVTNNSKATEVDNDRANELQPRTWGPVTVVNTDTVFNDGQLQPTGRVRLENGLQVFVNSPIAYTDRGATVINVPAGENAPIRYTNRGATITTVDNA